MTVKTFSHDFRRGLGSAVIELQKNPDRAHYRGIVLRCCKKNIAYDWQCEGTKGHYLYSAICALGAKEKDEFEGEIIAAFSKRLEYGLFCQLADILCLYAGGGSEKSREALCGKYQNLLDQVSRQRIFPFKYSEQTQLEYLTEYINGKKEKEETLPQGPKPEPPEITLEIYAAKAREYADDEYAFVRMRKFSMYLSKQAKQDEFAMLASMVECEQSDEIRANLLNVFRDVDFPREIAPLFDYAKSGSGRLREIAVLALGRFADGRVHDLALEFIASGRLDDGLELLLKNWRKEDEPLVRKYIMASKEVSHSMQQSVNDIYSRHRSKSCGDILAHIYKNGECTLCRSKTVRAMHKNRVLSEDILDECLCDSYEETRKFAKQKMRNKKLKEEKTNENR